MPIKLSQLKILCALVETGSVASAAEKMHCVPSNISTRIRELEDTLGVKMVNREKQRINITPEGRAFYQQATSLLEQSENCLSFFDHKRLKGQLRIGALDVAFQSSLNELVIQFMSQHPDVNIKLQCHPSLPLMNQILSGELDIVFVDGPVEHPMLVSRLFAPENLHLVTHLPTLESFYQSVDNLCLYSFGEHCFYHVLTEEWLSQKKLCAKQCHEIASYPLIIDSVRSKLGFTVMPGSFVKENPRLQGLHTFLLDSTVLCDIYVVWRKFNQSPVCNEFLNRFN